MLIAGCIDILRECYAAKNKLEKQLLPSEVQSCLDTLNISLETLAQKRAVFSELFCKYWNQACANDAALLEAKGQAFGEQNAEVVTPYRLEETLAQFGLSSVLVLPPLP